MNELIFILPEWRHVFGFSANFRRHLHASEQRKSMRDISRGDGVRSRASEKHKAKKKRKYQSSEKPSARAAAQEFLEKAARELLNSSECGVKGPLQNISDEDDE